MENEMKHLIPKEQKGKSYSVVKMILTLILFTFCTLLGFGSIWTMVTWPKLQIEEMIFELTQPLEGAGNMIWQFVYKAVFPTIACLILALLLYIFLFNKKKKRWIYTLSLIGISVIFMAVTVTTLWNRVGAYDYLMNKTSDSTFIEDEYVDPSDVELTFPEEKRNLIYIYLESMETTYSDTENGGAFETDVIPELTALSEDYDNFSGSDDTLNGGYVLPYTSC